MPAAQVAAGAAGQRGQRLGLPTARGGGLDGVEGPAEQVGGHDARGARADMDAQGEERLVVDLDGHAGPADRPGDGEVGAFAQDPGVQQGGDLTVDRRDGQLGDLSDHVAGDRATLAHRGEDRGARGVGDAQRRRDDVVAGPQRVRSSADGAGRAMGRKGGGSHGRCPSRVGAGPEATPGDLSGTRKCPVWSGAANRATTTRGVRDQTAGQTETDHAKNLAHLLELDS